MFWIQALTSFAVWIASGVFMGRLYSKRRPKFVKASRRKRTILAPLLMLGAPVMLLSGIFALYERHAIGPNGMTFDAWIWLTMCGGLFIQLQLLASAYVASLATETEPPGTGQTSDGRIKSNNSDEAQTAARP